jgi:hypothetical protein
MIKRITMIHSHSIADLASNSLRLRSDTVEMGMGMVNIRVKLMSEDRVEGKSSRPKFCWMLILILYQGVL